MVKANCVVAQSGGPTAAINSSLAGVIQEALQHEEIGEIWGARNGILGILREDFIDLRQEDRATLEALPYTPGAALGSCRYKLKISDYERIMDVFQARNIRYFFYIGGNDSMDTAQRVDELARSQGWDMGVIGIPKTIDNDLPLTDHCPGYGSAAKYLATSVLEMSIDLEQIVTSTKVLIIETMGRNTGWLAAATSLARQGPWKAPHLIYFPEVPFDLQSFVADVKMAYKELGQVVVAVAEGLVDAKGEYIFNDSQTVDAFGHQRLGGLGQYLQNLVETEVGIKGRFVVLSTAQRSAMHLASLTDLEEAYRVGAEAVKRALAGQTGIMVALQREAGPEYRCSFTGVPLREVANQERKMPREWINEAGNDVTPAFIEYASPLIRGEVKLNYRNGLPEYVQLKGYRGQQL